MKILITGAGGFLAGYLTRLLKAEKLILTDIREIDLSRFGDLDEVEKVSSEILDITDYNAVYEILSRIQPAVILHLAAYTDVSRAEKEKDKYYNRCSQVNVLGTANIALAVPQVKKKYPDSCFVVYLSTDYVFDGEKGMYTEQDEPKPINYYALTKWQGEEKILDTLLGHCLVIRTSFKPRPYKHPEAPTDMWFSADYVDKIAPEIALAVLHHHFVVSNTPNGIIHIATERKSAYDLALLTNQDVLPTTRAEIKVKYETDLPRDVSLDTSLWRHIRQALPGI